MNTKQMLSTQKFQIFFFFFFHTIKTEYKDYKRLLFTVESIGAQKWWIGILVVWSAKYKTWLRTKFGTKSSLHRSPHCWSDRISKTIVCSCQLGVWTKLETLTSLLLLLKTKILWYLRLLAFMIASIKASWVAPKTDFAAQIKVPVKMQSPKHSWLHTHKHIC